MIDASFWSGKRVFVTGHTGFKGSWLCEWLLGLGACVQGYSLPPNTDPNLFVLLGLGERLDASTFGDIRDRDAVFGAISASIPQVILHLASQPIVRRSIADPYGTFSTNVVGVVNVFDAARTYAPHAAIVNVTSDKVYANDESAHAFIEEDRLGGDDPYSASKACAELVTHSYRATYGGGGLWLASARAGNVIGGGDWAEDRLIPDMVRSIASGDLPVLRNPLAQRPWQHVLEPLGGYLLLAQHLASRDARALGAWNFGPAEEVLPPVHRLAEAFLEDMGHSAQWKCGAGPAPKEKGVLRVDSTKARSVLRWRSRLSIDRAVELTAQWYARWLLKADARAITHEQIQDYGN